MCILTFSIILRAYICLNVLNDLSGFICFIWDLGSEFGQGQWEGD